METTRLGTALEELNTRRAVGRIKLFRSYSFYWHLERTTTLQRVQSLPVRFPFGTDACNPQEIWIQEPTGLHLDYRRVKEEMSKIGTICM